MDHSVLLIFRALLEADLWALSRHAHVWLVGTPENKAAARFVWDRESQEFSPFRGVTTFLDPAGDPADALPGLLGTIDEHHGGFSAAEPWQTIRVVGIPIGATSAETVAAALGLRRVLLNPIESGFEIVRVCDGGPVGRVESMAEAWIEFQRTPEGTPEYEGRRSVVFDLDELCTSDPEAAWAVVVTIAEREADEEILGVLAAGPLESLLSRHGQLLIDRVERRARTDAKFRSVLGGLYQLLMTDELWHRVQAAARGSAA